MHIAIGEKIAQLFAKLTESMKTIHILPFGLRLCANTKLPERTDLMQKAPLNSRRRIYIRREGLNGGSKPKYNENAHSDWEENSTTFCEAHGKHEKQYTYFLLVCGYAQIRSSENYLILCFTISTMRTIAGDSTKLTTNSPTKFSPAKPRKSSFTPLLNPPKASGNIVGRAFKVSK